ncbi:E3 ubiquitin-protein ligase synoviolin [Pseudohyphozyma bogoriensis]|nr:E3 ubiquitin-protein ligase synoviolin [Pseudohyphozyma bogoriensis]
MAVGLSRLSLYGLASTSVFLYTILHAFRQRSNFYSAAVYLSKSNACTMILWNQGIYQTVFFGKFLQTIFFGELRLLEVERLQERGWFAVTETLLALTIFKDEFDSSFVLFFVGLLFLKVFHWLAADRIELASAFHFPLVFGRSRLIGVMGALLSWLWLFDALLLAYAVESILLDGPTVMIMFASEYMILLAAVWSTTMKYGLNVMDLRSEEPWEEKSMYVFYVELATDFFKLLTYLAFFGLILTFYGLPLNILRDVYLTFRSFVLKCRDLRRYRQATRNMDSLYPNATAEEMEQMADKMCIICREDMAPPAPVEAAAQGNGDGQGQEGQAAAPAPASPAVRGPNETPKRLPCGHVFHFHCLRSCRRPVLPSEQGRAPPVVGPGAPAAAAAAAAAPGIARNQPEDVIRQAQINLARNMGREAYAVVFPGIPFPPEAEGAAPPAQPAGAAPANRAAPPPTPTATVPPPDGAHPTPTPTTPAGAAGPSSANPTASSPLAGPSTSSPPAGPTASTSTTPVPRQPGGLHDNPLARFSLPEFRLPPTGEAGLYSPPPVNGFVGVAYGAYPAPAGAPRQGYPGQPPQGGQTRVPNLEERLSVIRSRMSQLVNLPTPALTPTTPSTTPASSSTVNGTTTTSAESTSTSTPTPTTASLAATSPSTPAPSESSGPSEGNAREAALAAAERRQAAAAARLNGSALKASSLQATTGTTPASSPLPSPLAELSAPAVVVSPPASETKSTPPSVEEEPTASTTVPPSSTTADSIPAPPSATSPQQFPRLIPLFGANSTSGPSAYPHLFSTLPPPAFGSSLDGTGRPLSTQALIPDSPTEEQLRELSQLTRAGIQERLRVLVNFQDRLAALAQDMGQVLSVLPPDDAPVGGAKGKEVNGNGEGEEAFTKSEKGKAPTEGVNAA